MRVKRLVISLLAGFGICAIAACNAPEPKLAHVKTETAGHAVYFSGKEKHISQAELQMLDGFVHSVTPFSISYAGLKLDDSDKQAVARAKQIRNYLVAQGVAPDVIHVQPAPGADAGMIPLIIEYAVAVPPAPCPDWSKNALSNYDNTRFSNYGCAYYNNLAVQLENPADIEHGGGTATVTDVSRENIQTQKYTSSASMQTDSSSSSASAPTSSR